ncbi:multiple epidermal growth factor-like domains protein 10 [Liolophura sinensis]|uniref:multiple epidermal growth factor-like domains protein 10 n=1 Tax=Liolophura sinensis TaxID=3198878 RepID=UPI003158F9CA
MAFTALLILCIVIGQSGVFINSAISKDKECPQRHYGDNCKSICPLGCKDHRCDKTTGDCNKGCAVPYLWGAKCDKECSINCGSDQNGDQPCNQSDSACVHGCLPGFQQPDCEKPCDSNMYGDKCTLKCGACAYGDSCSNEDGTCSRGCAEGYLGDKCDTECDPYYYGDGCSESCGQCSNFDVCNFKNGSCPNGCEDGWTGDTCSDMCPTGSYGDFCLNTCGKCAQSVNM